MDLVGVGNSACHCNCNSMLCRRCTSDGEPRLDGPAPLRSGPLVLVGGRFFVFVAGRKSLVGAMAHLAQTRCLTGRCWVGCIHRPRRNTAPDNPMDDLYLALLKETRLRTIGIFRTRAHCP